MTIWRKTTLKAGMVSRRAAGMLAWMAVVCAVGAGCQSSDTVWLEKGVPYPFAPANVRIHSLTHMERDEEGEPVLVCHVVLVDPWGESVRGVGHLKVSLFGPANPVSTEDAAWEFDLNDLPENTALYDAATRTYRLQLGDLPAWAVEMSSGENGAGSSMSGSIVAVLTMIGLGGETITVQGQSRLQR